MGGDELKMQAGDDHEQGAQAPPPAPDLGKFMNDNADHLHQKHRHENELNFDPNAFKNELKDAQVERLEKQIAAQNNAMDLQ